MGGEDLVAKPVARASLHALVARIRVMAAAPLVGRCSFKPVLGFTE